MSGVNFFAFLTISNADESCLPLGDLSVETKETAWTPIIFYQIRPTLDTITYNFVGSYVQQSDLTSLYKI